MPINNFSTGHDVSIDMTDPTTGHLLNWPPVTGFSAEPMFAHLQARPLDLPPSFAEIPDGWNLSIEFDRHGNTIDQFFARLEALYYQGVNTLAGSIMQTIKETDGSITQFQFIGVVMKLSQAGQWHATSKVSQSVTATASTRLNII